MGTDNPKYDTIGVGYREHRKIDDRVVDVLHSMLDLPQDSLIADIGAGTGNYSGAIAEKGYKIKAIEPSAVMRIQSQENERTEWINGAAENIPLDDNSVDGIMIVLAIHHFVSLKVAADEMYRICPKGPVVVFTCDPRESAEFWFADYFPEIWQDTFKVFPPINVIVQNITMNKDWSVERAAFPLPHDLKDKFMISGWRTPELYLDPTFRQGTSGFALGAEEGVVDGLTRLRKDIESGEWDRKYGYLKQQSSFEAGFQFLKFKAMD